MNVEVHTGGNAEKRTRDDKATYTKYARNDDDPLCHPPISQVGS